MDAKPAACAIISAALLAGSTLRATADTVFQDGFETGALGTAWLVTGSNDGRCVVTTNFVPAAGQWQMVLDDAVNDAVYSVSEATLVLNLSHKKNVVLAFSAKSLGNEPDAPPAGNFTTTRLFDGVSVSADGGTTWRTVQSLAAVSTNWQTFTLPLDSAVAALAGGFGDNFRIRFSEYDNASAPVDGIAIDDVVVTAEDDQRSVLELPTPVVEGAGPYTGYVMLTFASTNVTTLTLTAIPTNQLILPAQVVVPPGQTYASFSFSVADNNLVDLTRTVTVSATASNVTASAATMTVLDNDVPTGTLTLPAQLVEGQLPTNNAMFSLDRPTAVALPITLTASPAGELSLPSTITIAAGQTQAVFTVRAVDDTRIDGNILVSVTASNAALAPVTAQTLAVDNEPRTLTLNMPTSLVEGGTGTGTVSIAGTLPNALDVKLTSANEAALTVSSVATIPAGQTSAAFTLSALDNTLRDGTRVVNVSATADGFMSTNRNATIRDNDPASYRFSAMPDIMNVSSPLLLTLQASDVEGNVISNLSGTVNLSVVLPDGRTLPMSPASVTLAGGSAWSGIVSFPSVGAAPLRLRAADANGVTSDSAAFDILRVLKLQAADLTWNASNNLLYASVPASATDTNANRVVAIDPVTLQITGTVLTTQDPGQLALTSGGEYLYAALNANGSICRINPTTMTVDTTFAIGTDPSYGTMYASDICPVAGQPGLLVVSRYVKSVSPSHDGVAVFDNGVARPNTTQSHTGSNIIEPSADPSLFFGYNTESTEYGFRQLRLDANGMTQIQVNGSLFSGGDMRSDGNLVFTTGGVEVEGSQMRRAGVFGVSGLVRPEMTANRVYFLESSNDRIGAYDPTTFSLIRKLMLPTAVSGPASFVRWGTNGLAFRSGTNVYLVSSSQLVPSGAPADLAVTVQATPNPATALAPLTYTINLSNQGPNVAVGAILGATLSSNQTLQSVTASLGSPVVSNAVVTLAVGNLEVGASVTLTVTVLPQSAGSLSCSASTTSQSVEPDYTDNTAAKLVSVGFQSTPDSVNRLQLSANNLVYDPLRGVIWASIPSTVPAPLGRSIVSIDPVTGLMSDPIAINGSPVARCMALSANGRYLYVGLTDAPEVHRLDLSTTPPTSLRVPMGLNQWSQAGYAEDIESLAGDGTSFLVTTYGDDGAAVFDGLTRRATRSGIYTVDRIERTSDPGVFVGYDNSDTSFAASSLTVSSTGVSISRSVWSLFSGFGVDMSGDGNLALSSTGVLVDSVNLTLKASFGVSGRPCLDFPYQRAYIVNGNALRGFDTATSLSTGNFTLPVTQTGDWAQCCIRWGMDGFAILGNDGNIYIARWSATIPPTVDANHNGIPDAWEAANFLSLKASAAADTDRDGIANGMEYVFGTSPLQASANPLRVSLTNVAGQKMLRLAFPRRAGLSPRPYGYESSDDLMTWSPASSVTENVLSTQSVNGILMENVEALAPATNAVRGFVRFKWLNP